MVVQSTWSLGSSTYYNSWTLGKLLKLSEPQVVI